MSFSKSNKTGRVMLFAVVVLALMLPEMAYAQSGIPGLNLLKAVIDALGGEAARYIAGIAAIAVGIGCYGGRIEWDRIKAWFVGSAFVFGFAQFVTFVSRV